MTFSEFVGCTCLAFGAPTAMFIFTIATDPIRILIMIAASFFWLLSLFISSLFWFVVTPLREQLAFGMFFSVIFQEIFRFLIYKLLRKTENGLKEITDNEHITDNKHILAYVSGLGFGIISGLFALVNVLADSVGPATMGLKSGTDMFFITSAAQTLCIILLHTFWSVIFFHACDIKSVILISFVGVSHMFVSLITLLNANEMYFVTLFINYIILVIVGVVCFKIAGGSRQSLLRFLTCK